MVSVSCTALHCFALCLAVLQSHMAGHGHGRAIESKERAREACSSRPSTHTQTYLLKVLISNPDSTMLPFLLVPEHLLFGDLEDDGDEEVHHHKLPEDDKGDKVEDCEWAPADPVLCAVVHNGVPALPSRHAEEQQEGAPKVLKVRRVRDEREGLVVLAHDADRAVEAHPEAGVDEKEEHEHHPDVHELWKGTEDGVDEVPDRPPPFDQAEDARDPEDAQDVDVKELRSDHALYQVDDLVHRDEEVDDDDGKVKAVEAVGKVAFSTQAVAVHRMRVCI